MNLDFIIGDIVSYISTTDWSCNEYVVIGLNETSVEIIGYDSHNPITVTRDCLTLIQRPILNLMRAQGDDKPSDLVSSNTISTSSLNQNPNILIHDGVNRMLNSESFKKFDNGKPDYSLFEPSLMEAYCKVGSMGAKKYGRNNWKKAKIEDIPRYMAAFARHYFNGFMVGEELDSESGLPHLHHAIWNMAAINYFIGKFGYGAVMKHTRGENDE